jgi:hypothetical protein
MKLNLVLIVLMAVFTISCNKDDETDPINTTNEELPTSIVLKNIPSGTFTMG